MDRILSLLGEAQLDKGVAPSSPRNHPDKVIPFDEFDFSSKLLPYVLLLFQDSYHEGLLLSTEKKEWSVYQREEEAE